MNEIVLADRIVVSRNVRHGHPCIAGTRITVYQVLDLLAGGKTPPEITSPDYFPTLTEADVLACIADASHLIQDERSGKALTH